MKIEFAPEAAQELDEAVKWYENEKEGLGYRFAHVVDETILRCVRYPAFNTEVKPGIYRALVKRFPYGIFYGIDGTVLTIYAVSHLHREPFYWSPRTG